MITATCLNPVSESSCGTTLLSRGNFKVSISVLGHDQHRQVLGRTKSKALGLVQFIPRYPHNASFLFQYEKENF